MNNPLISMIAIISKNRGLGKDNKLLFHIPGELARFREITMGGKDSERGHAIIMGRKTFESIGLSEGLPKRLNIVLSRNAYQKKNGVIFLPVDNDWRKVLGLAKDWEFSRDKDDMEIFIIGGGQIYEQAMPFANRLYLTVVDKDTHADTFFPDYSEFKKVIEKEEMKNGEYTYTFLTLEK